MSKHPNQRTQYVTPRGAAQDTSRHKPRAAANHLSPAELKKRDAGAVESDAERLAAVQASRLSKPPHQHRFDCGNKCKICGLEVKGLADGLRAIGYTEGEVAEAMALCAEDER